MGKRMEEREGKEQLVSGKEKGQEEDKGKEQEEQGRGGGTLSIFNSGGTLFLSLLVTKNTSVPAHPNIYDVVSLFKSEQAATEVTLMQVAGGRLPV